MAFYTDGVVPWNSLDDNTRGPLSSELESGYPCGEADQQLFNWTAGWPIGNIWNMLLQSGITPDADRLLDLARSVQTGKVNYAVAGGTANALTATLSPAPAALTPGLVARIVTSAANTASVTLNVNGLGVKNVVSKSGQALAPGQLPAGTVAEFVYDGTNFQVAIPFAVLGAPRTYYVNAAAGNDANDGLTAGTAFATIQRAINAAATWQPNSSYAITIQLAAGTYAGFTTPDWAFPPVIIDGVSPGSATITGTAQFLCTVSGRNTVTFKNLSTSNTGNVGLERCFFATSGATINVENVTFAGTPNTPGGSAFCFSTGGGTINVVSCTIAGNAFTFFYAGVSSLISVAGATITISGSRTAVTSFVGAGSLGQVAAGGATFVNPGNMSGKRYEASLNGIINTLGGGANFFPGTIAGSVSTGGQYA